jgi:hypothetical protein
MSVFMYLLDMRALHMAIGEQRSRQRQQQEQEPEQETNPPLGRHGLDLDGEPEALEPG